MSAYQFCVAFVFTLYVGLVLNMRRPSRRAPEGDDAGSAVSPGAPRDDCGPYTTARLVSSQRSQPTRRDGPVEKPRSPLSRVVLNPRSDSRDARPLVRRDA